MITNFLTIRTEHQFVEFKLGLENKITERSYLINNLRSSDQPQKSAVAGIVTSLYKKLSNFDQISMDAANEEMQSLNKQENYFVGLIKAF